MIDLRLRSSTEIQGDVLAGFKKDHCAFLLLHFQEAGLAREWLNEIADQLSYTNDVAKFNEDFSDARRANGGIDPADMTICWVGLSLTADGIGKVAPRLLESLSFEFRERPVGRAEHVGDTGDDAPEHWNFGADHHVDALLTIAADTTDLLDDRLTIEQDRCTRYKIEYEVEKGDTIARPDGKPGTQEHFGFREGVFQPGIKDFDIPDPTGKFVDGHPDRALVAAGEFVLGEVQERPEIGQPRQQGVVHPALVDGSYQVFRRLKQDVPKFLSQVEAFVRTNVPQDPTITNDLVSSKLVGRDADGHSLHHLGAGTQTPNPLAEPSIDYGMDKDGLWAPRFAHVRRMRTGVGRVADPKTRRILRRSIPYGRQFIAGDEESAGEDRGIFFIAYMTSIYNQFEWLQRMWASSTFNRADGVDPVIGTGETDHTLKHNGREYELIFARSVYTTGALYGFVPSRSALHRMATGEFC